MKTNFLLYFPLIMVFSTAAFTQSVKIVTKRVVYDRPNVAADDANGLKTFIIKYPKISGVKGKTIEDYFNYERIFDFKVKEEIQAERGIRQADYKVLFNDKNILSIKLTLDAQTFSDLHYEKFISVNTKTAKLLKPSEVFRSLKGLAAKCRKSQLREINNIKKSFSRDDYGELFDTLDFTSANLSNFTVSKKGITFHDDYRFARTAVMFEPNKDYFFSWMNLKPFIRRDGLLRQFIH